MATLGQEKYKKELIKKYKEYDKQDTKDISWSACLARDNKRKIKKIFFKNFHYDIQKELDKL